MLDVRGWETESFRSVACVKWKPTSTNVYRVGHKGKVLYSLYSYLLSIMLHCVYTKYSLDFCDGVVQDRVIQPLSSP